MTTEEDLLQEQYMGNRESRQLHLGYHEQWHRETRKRKMKRALSVRILPLRRRGASILR